MEELGVVIRKKDRMVVIKAQRTSACEGCASKKDCATGGSDNEMLIEAENTVGADVGDRVAFTVGAGSVLKAGLILYLFPLACFIAGVVLGQTLLAGFLPGWNPDLVSGIAGVVFLLIAFGGLKLYSAVLDKSKSYKPQILRVV